MATEKTERNRGAVFHVSLLYNLLLQDEQRRPWWSHIEPRLILGALPLRNKSHLDQVGVACACLAGRQSLVDSV
jgi:hypothetical protein